MRAAHIDLLRFISWHLFNFTLSTETYPKIKVEETHLEAFKNKFLTTLGRLRAH